ncbi:MAG TPA: hypothetical protein VKR26_14035, partial [Terriglobales bacterium]|nr:hypothetical protein [Terriglobales bacterium]
KAKGAALSRPFFGWCFKCLQRFYVLCLPALGPFYDVELDLLSFLQAAKAAGLDGREVDEYIFAILAADEAIALRVVEPLYSSCFHCVANSFSGDFCCEIKRRTVQAGAIQRTAHKPLSIKRKYILSQRNDISASICGRGR